MQRYYFLVCEQKKDIKKHPQLVKTMDVLITEMTDF